ncbi:MAG: hypothetical protein DSY34_04235 [Desulfurobacterium sp.]|nr:MAG: hypothetical protein DSY34_04235 [Desulfurobacterium sp.]
MDTNAILYYLADKNIASVKAEFVISFITEIEVLSYPNLTEQEEEKIREFLRNVYIVNVNNDIKNLTVNFRKRYGLKLPDAMICASACFLKLPLITNDKQMFRVSECSIFTYSEFKERYTL